MILYFVLTDVIITFGGRNHNITSCCAVGDINAMIAVQSVREERSKALSRGQAITRKKSEEGKEGK